MAIKKDIKSVSGLKKFLELNSLLKIVSVLFILSITVLAIVNIFERKEGGVKDQNTIVVSGHGEVNAAPDTTKFTISVTESGKEIKSSQAAVTVKINAALAVLKQSGILDKNIKTLNFNTYPKYSTRTGACEVSVAPNKASSIKAKPLAVQTSAVGCIDKTSVVIGYETNQSIEVKVTDISKNPDLAGILVTSLGKVGVQTSELTNYVDNLDEIKSLVRYQAIQKAKAQAKDISESLGVKLGKITSFSENSGGGYPYPMMMSAKAVGTNDVLSASLPVGENKITSDVSVTYSIR